MANMTDFEAQDANLKHIYFFIDEKIVVRDNDETQQREACESSIDSVETEDTGIVMTPPADSDPGANDETAAVRRDSGVVDDESALPGSNGSGEAGSRPTSKHSNKTGSTENTSTSTSDSDLNPLANTFKPRFTDSGTPFIPPPPSAGQNYELRKTADKGFSLFATKFIKRGTLIISEAPLLKIPGHDAHLAWGPYARLDRQEKMAFDSLYGYEPKHMNLDQVSRTHLIDYTDDSLDADDIEEIVAEHVRVMRIFNINNIEVPGYGLAIYATASRLNHSCVPNVHHSYNPNLKAVTVYAVHDVHPDQELLTTYTGGGANYHVRSQRVERLRENYGFTCRCQACSDRTGASDKRRAWMADLAWGLQQFSEGANPNDQYIPGNAHAALLQAEDLIGFMLEEGIVTIELVKAYRLASRQALHLQNYDKALEYARDEAEIEHNCLGTELTDMKKTGTASECWIDSILRTIRVEKGDAVADQYCDVAGRLRKHMQKNWKKNKNNARKQAKWTGSGGGPAA